MRKAFLRIIFGFLVFGVFLNWGLRDVRAYQIETLPGTAVEGDVVLGPGKLEVWLEPGEKVFRTIYFTNRTGRTIDFLVNIEDFKGSKDPKAGTIFLGEEKGPYSLRDYLHPTTEKFTLEHGQRISLPVEIAIPEDAEPGGRYGVVFASALPPKIEVKPGEQEAKPMVGIIARVGCLFFVRVKGDADENGLLKGFQTKEEKRYFEKGPISFELLYENNGNVHLAPYGLIEIFNLLGRKVGEVEVDPYFAMPDSVRLREIEWDRGFLFGKYTALVSINRGYQDIIDEASLNFWVIPWKIVLIGLLVLAVIIWFFRWIITHFEFRRKPLPPVS